MPEQRIGTCSICGGDVIGHVGAWMATIPPPPPKCRNCGAVSAAHDPVIEMRPMRNTPWGQVPEEDPDAQVAELQSEIERRAQENVEIHDRSVAAGRRTVAAFKSALPVFSEVEALRAQLGTQQELNAFLKEKLDESDGEMVKAQREAAAFSARLARLDELLRSEEPPEGLNKALYMNATATYAALAWRWFREALAGPPAAAQEACSGCLGKGFIPSPPPFPASGVSEDLLCWQCNGSGHEAGEGGGQ